MKTTSLNAVRLLLFLLITTLTVKANVKNDSLFTATMSSTVLRLDTLNNINDIQSCKMTFERLHQIYPDSWLPIYYIAYSNLKTFYNNPKNEKRKLILEESLKNIESLKTHPDANKSEVLTLEGYYYTALIMLDPANNGQKYFQNVFSSYEEAIELNPQNPRPICLLTFFEQQLPKMFQSKRNVKEQYDKAKLLFSKEDKTSYLPHWGENYLDYINIK